MDGRAAPLNLACATMHLGPQQPRRFRAVDRPPALR